jgi:hypothetical protein
MTRKAQATTAFTSPENVHGIKSGNSVIKQLMNQLTMNFLTKV